MLESHDWGGAIHPRDDRTQHAIDAMLAHLTRSGFDREYGRKLVHELEQAGLEQVAAGGRLHAYRGGSPEAAFLRLSLESLGPALVDAGDLTPSDVQHALAAIDDASTAFLSAPLIAAWGRRGGR